MPRRPVHWLRPAGEAASVARMKIRLFAPLLLAALAACTQVPDDVVEDPPAVAPLATPVGIAPVTTGAAPDGAAAAAGRAPEIATGVSDPGFLGFSVTSLGDVTSPGLWLETPLVAEEGPGRVVSENGLQLDLLLKPTGGARDSGSRLSLEGYQALGLDLAATPTLTVMGMLGGG